MQKTTLTISLIFVFAAFFTACDLEINPNGRTEYNHVSILDEGDMYVATGNVDNVFAGKVVRKVSNNPNDGDPRTVYKVDVLENLKGELIENIELAYPGGYLENGTLILHRGDILTDDGLPVISDTYIFSTFSQRDGSLLVASLTGKKIYSDTAKAEAVNYIIKQKEISRQRYPSKFDKQ